MDGNFTKLIFSNELFIMNGIYILFPIDHNGSEKIMNKTQIRFNPFQQYNQTLINEFSKLEKNILEYYKQTRMCNCKIVPLLQKQMLIGFMKTNKEYKNQFLINENNKNILYVLKISGIWETKDEIGLTYKLFEVNNNTL
uniref:Uncharacterized protein n=1 Tax=viral metagenome TaxID=1070528 RepID=A0A6C0DCG7_9ZZZZ